MSDQPTSPADPLLDLFVYAPIGLVLEAARLFPTLVNRGRGEVNTARAVGTFALDKVKQTVDANVERTTANFIETVFPRGDAPKPDSGKSAKAPQRNDRQSSDDGGGLDIVDAEIISDSNAPTKRAKTTSKTAKASSSKTSPAKSSSAKSSSAKSSSAKSSSTKGSAKKVVDIDVTDLPIPSYDELSASQVVPMLRGLRKRELIAVRGYETSHRGRKTILGRVAQLLAE